MVHKNGGFERCGEIITWDQNEGPASQFQCVPAKWANKVQVRLNIESGTLHVQEVDTFALTQLQSELSCSLQSVNVNEELTGCLFLFCLSLSSIFFQEILIDYNFDLGSKSKHRFF